MIIIAEGLFQDYCKKRLSPKEYVKIYIKKYKSIEKYIETHDIIPAIKEYKKLKLHKKGELYLADFIRDH